ncbi:hypothetical protein ABQF26_36230, partial [Mycolicibacterium elephantis]
FVNRDDIDVFYSVKYLLDTVEIAPKRLLAKVMAPNARRPVRGSQHSPCTTGFFSARHTITLSALGARGPLQQGR